MALPVTITGISTAVATGGPFKAPNGAYYFFGRDGTTATTLQAYKSTAPDTSWSSVATKTGFTTAILNLSAYQAGTVVHILVNDGTQSTSFATKYVSFDTSTDTFLATIETISAAVAVTGQAGGGGAGGSLVVRSNGDVVAFYSGVQTKTSGTFRMRVYYRVRTAVNTWSAETQVDNNTAIDNTWPFSTLGAANRVHFFWGAASAAIHYRTLSAANALNTGSSTTAVVVPGDCVSYDRGGVTKVVVTTNASGQGTLYCNSSDNPTVSTANQSIAAASAPHRIGVNTSTNDVTIVYRSTADSDLWAIKSTDDGATFGTPVSFFVGTVANNDAHVSRSTSGSVYQRESNIVVGYLVNDNGTLKYNEYIVGSAFSPARVDLALSSTAPTASVLAGFPNISPAQANLALSPTQAAVGVVKDLTTANLALTPTAPTRAVDLPRDIPQGNLALSPTAPTAAQSLFANPPRVDLALSTTAPTASAVGAGLNISPPRVDLVISGSQAAVGAVKVLDADDLVLSPTAPSASVSGGAVGISPPRVDLALSATAPTAILAVAADPARRDLLLSPTAPTAVFAISRDIPQGNLALSTSAPSLSVLSGLIISPPTVSLAVTPTQPAVGTVKDLNAGNLVVSTTAPSVGTGASAAINIPQGNLALTTVAPQPVVLSGLVISPATVNLAITPTQPAIGAAKDLNADDLSISTTAPTVSIPTGAVSRSPPAVNLAISSLAPDAGLASDMPIAQLVISTTAPTRSVVGAGTSMSPARVDLVVSRSVPTVTVSAANNTTITPDTRDLVISRTAPTVLVTVHANVVPSTRDLVLSTTAPSVELAVTSCIILPPSVNLLLSTSAASAIRTAPPRPQFVRYVRPMTHIMRRW